MYKQLMGVSAHILPCRTHKVPLLLDKAIKQPSKGLLQLLVDVVDTQTLAHAPQLAHQLS